MYTSNIQERNIFVSILLTILTCGIYGIYWFFSLIATIYNIYGSDDNFAFEVVVSILTCGLYSFYMIYKAGNRLNAIKSTNYQHYTETSTTLLIILQLVSLQIINCCILQDELNTIKNKKSDLIDM